MAAQTSIMKATVLSAKRREYDGGALLSCLIQWWERGRTKGTFDQQRAQLTVFSADEVEGGLNTNDKINVAQAKLKLVESPSWIMTRASERFDESKEAKKAVFPEFTTYGNQVEVVERGDPTSRKSFGPSAPNAKSFPGKYSKGGQTETPEVGRKVFPTTDHDDDDLPF